MTKIIATLDLGAGTVTVGSRTYRATRAQAQGSLMVVEYYVGSDRRTLLFVNREGAWVY